MSRNKTITLNTDEIEKYGRKLLDVSKPTTSDTILNKTILGDTLCVLPLLPDNSVDLVFADPPYRIKKSFGGTTFDKLDFKAYENWLLAWVPEVKRLLKPNGTAYFCGDWRFDLHPILRDFFNVRNRITWGREKGRGAKFNWKNAHEDIWYCTVGNNYTFNVDAVKLQRKVKAPYRNAEGKPKDWQSGANGNTRLTYPSNFWRDLTVPFWSMAENTPHPTQKPEKLLAKIILASSNHDDVVLDPFVGSGTTSVVAKKLGRQYIGIDNNRKYCCFTEKRLERANTDKRIQGYNGTFQFKY